MLKTAFITLHPIIDLFLFSFYERHSRCAHISAPSRKSFPEKSSASKCVRGQPSTRERQVHFFHVSSLKLSSFSYANHVVRRKIVEPRNVLLEEQLNRADRSVTVLGNN